MYSSETLKPGTHFESILLITGICVKLFSDVSRIFLVPEIPLVDHFQHFGAEDENIDFLKNIFQGP